VIPGRPADKSHDIRREGSVGVQDRPGRGFVVGLIGVAASPESPDRELDPVTSKLNGYNPRGLQPSPHNGVFSPVFDTRPVIMSSHS
jgi:hypothetical protein